MTNRISRILDDDDDDDNASQKEGSRLCKICDQIGRSDVRWLINTKIRFGIGIYLHRRDLHSLKTSALNECRLCQLILSTVVDSDDARKAEMIIGESFRDCELILGAKMSLSERERLLQESRQESSFLPTCFPIVLRNLDASQGLHRLSELCGNGRVLLIGKDWPSVIPDNLRAVVLYPFGAFDTRDAHEPFVTGLPFELATGHGTRNVLACR